MNFVRLELSNCETVPINGEELLKPKKAFQNQDWLTTSKAAKPLRVLSELVETEERLKAGAPAVWPGDAGAQDIPCATK